MGTEKLHSKLGASSSDRWMECPGSVALCETVPKSKDTAYSKEGTDAHSLMEFVLKNPPANARYYIGKEKAHGLDFKVTQEMADHVQKFVDNVRWTFHQLPPGATMHVEKSFQLKHLHPDLWGTADVVIIQPFGTIYVIDFKYGAGVRVDVEENSQLLYYGIGGSYGEDFQKLVLVIAQPRIEGGEWQEWETTPEYLLEFSKILKQKALETQKPNAPLKDGEWCRWCSAKSVCPQLQKKAVAIAQNDFKEDTKLPALTSLSDEQIVRIVEAKGAITSWIKAVEDAAYLRLMNGEKIPGLKLVRGKGKREWLDEDEVKEAFGAKIMSKPELMSPSKAEKVLGKTELKEFILNVKGGYQVAHEDDKRPESLPPKDDFSLIESFSEDDF